MTIRTFVLVACVPVLSVVACARTPAQQLEQRIIDRQNCHDAASCNALIREARETYEQNCPGGQGEHCASIRGEWRKAIERYLTEAEKPALIAKCGASSNLENLETSDCGCDAAREFKRIVDENAAAELDPTMVNHPRWLCPGLAGLPECMMPTRCWPKSAHPECAEPLANPCARGSWDARRCTCGKGTASAAP